MKKTLLAAVVAVLVLTFGACATKEKAPEAVDVPEAVEIEAEETEEVLEEAE